MSQQTAANLLGAGVRLCGTGRATLIFLWRPDGPCGTSSFAAHCRGGSTVQPFTSIRRDLFAQNSKNHAVVEWDALLSPSKRSGMMLPPQTLLPGGYTWLLHLDCYIWWLLLPAWMLQPVVTPRLQYLVGVTLPAWLLRSCSWLVVYLLVIPDGWLP